MALARQDVRCGKASAAVDDLRRKFGGTANGGGFVDGAPVDFGRPDIGTKMEMDDFQANVFALEFFDGGDGFVVPEAELSRQFGIIGIEFLGGMNAKAEAPVQRFGPWQ